MAYIYTTASPGTTFNYNKCMLGIFNGVGSGKVITIYRVWQMNAQTVAVTGLNVIMGLWRLTTGSGGFLTQVTKHDSANPSLPSQITCATELDYAPDPTNYRFTRYMWSSDEPSSAGVNGIDEMQTQPNFGLVMDYTMSYTNTTIVPPTIREGYGFAIIHEGSYSTATLAQPVGSADFFIEFSCESSS